VSEDDGDQSPPDAAGNEQDAGQDSSAADKKAAKSEVAPQSSKKEAVSKGKAKAKPKKEPKPGMIARFRLFLRQVIAELRKVIWPTRKELIDYTVVVLIFVVIMAAILALYDFTFAKGVFFVFGE
jgi:preprotein translocase subunit SecE